MESVLDKALSEIGQDGKFQNRFDILYNVFVAALWGVTYMNIFLVLVIIPHHCELPEKPVNISEDLWKLKHIPQYQNVAGKLEYSSCLIYTDPIKNNNTKGCDRYKYNTTWYQSTVPSENNWVCDEEINVSNIFAYSKIGEVTGSLLFGWFGDVYGRRWTYIISIVLIVLGRLISVLGSKSYIWFLCGCFISCFPSWSVMQSLTVISLEIYSSKRRTRSTTLRNVSWTIGVCLMPFLYWWLKEWKLFLIVSTAPIVPFMLFSWKMIESPRWLWVEGKPKECLKYLDIIANTNNRKLKESTRNEILTTRPLKDNIQILGPLALFSTWRLSINTVLQLILWVSCTISYTVLTINSAETTITNPFVEFFWQSAVEIPGICLGEWLANHLGRRYASVNAYFTTAAMWTLVLIRKSIDENDWFGSWWMGTIITLINRLSTSVTFYTINLFNMELYPTCLRQAGMSLGNVVSSCAAGVSSYIIFLGHQVDPRLPGLILIGLSLLGMVSSFFLPETLNTKLPETIEDAKTFGKNRKYFRIKRRV